MVDMRINSFILKAAAQANEEEVHLCQSLQEFCLLRWGFCFALRGKQRLSSHREGGREHCGLRGQGWPWGMAKGASGAAAQPCSDHLLHSVLWEHFENWQKTTEEMKGKALE